MDLIREVRVSCHGFGEPIQQKVLLKMLPRSTTVSAVKDQLAQILTNQFISTDKLPLDQIETIAPPDRQTLTFKQEVLWDDFGLDHYKFRNVLGQNYAELNLYLSEAMAEEVIVDVSVKARSAWIRAGTQVRKKVHQAFVPDPKLATVWLEKAGFPYESQATRHARTRFGTKGLIELLKEYPKHSTSAEECCWALLHMASQSEDANDFRSRLIFEGLTPVVVRSFQRALKKLHWGCMKQSLGLLYYLAKDQSKEYMQKLCEYKLIELSAEAIKFVTRGLEKLNMVSKTTALASAFCDIAELACNLMSCIVTIQDGRGVFKGLKVKKVFAAIIPQLDGVPYQEYVTTAFENCTMVAARKKRK